MPPGCVCELRRTSCPVTQMAPAFGDGDLVGDGLGDFDGGGDDLVGEGVGVLTGVELRDGLGAAGRLGVLVGEVEVDGLGVLVAVAVPVGLGALDSVGSLVGPGLRVGVALTVDLGPASGSAPENCVAPWDEGTPPVPHRLLRARLPGASSLRGLVGDA
jgi:hypothetical protein